ncbi:MAG: transcriptional regulator, family, partial [Caulobacteraceae bacterium]|nr:transcriptional regulator, family [Caulobacteraceae bacterium]
SVDRHVGNSIRTRRRTLGISQEELGVRLGLTFQQVQKYEKGINRVSASKLHAIAEVLDVPVSYFFEGLSSAEGDQSLQSEREATRALMSTSDGREMAELWRDASLPERRAILTVFRLMRRAD